MIITLYKNCVLNDKYRDIFCNRTILESYLSGLQSYTITVDNTFSRNEDSLFIENVPNTFDALDYNYMKVQDNMITFYAFITRIDWLSEAYIIRYKEDIIANHFDKIKVRNGLQTRTKIKKKYDGTTQYNIKYFKEPIQSESNNPVIIQPIMEQVATTQYDASGNYNVIAKGAYDKVSFLVKLQLYTLQTGTDIQVDREPIIYLVAVDNQGWTYDLNVNIGTTNAMDYILNTLVKNQPSYEINGKRYEIDQIFAVPSYLVTDHINLTTAEQNALKTFDGITPYIGFTEITNKYGMLYELESELPYDRKLMGIGLINKVYEVLRNGTSTKCKIRLEIYGYTLSIYLYVQNNLYEITQMFEVDIPYEPVSAEALQTRRINLAIKNSEIARKIDNLNIDKQLNNTLGILGGVRGGIGIANGVMSTAQGDMNGVTGILGSAVGLAENTVTRLANLDKIDNELIYLDTESYAINKKMYANANIVSNNVSYKSALYGLITYKIDEENTSQIEALQSMTGYVVNELVKDCLSNSYKNYLVNNNTYDIIAFSEINIYGTISQNYLREIERILNAGVRIWGSTNINV